jgi:hypothetical protein
MEDVLKLAYVIFVETFSEVQCPLRDLISYSYIMVDFTDRFESLGFYIARFSGSPAEI